MQQFTSQLWSSLPPRASPRGTSLHRLYGGVVPPSPGSRPRCWQACCAIRPIGDNVSRSGQQCHEVTAPAPLGKWGSWVVVSSGEIDLVPTVQHVIFADGVTLPGPAEGGKGGGIDTDINGQVSYWGPHGWTVDYFVGGEKHRFTTARAAGADITARFQSAGLIPTWATVTLCP